MNRLSRFVISMFILFLVFMPFIGLTQVLPPPTPPIEAKELTLQKIEDIIKTFATFMITVGVIIAVIFIIWGGVLWMAAGGDDEKVKTAKKRMISGLVGGLIVLGVGLILRTLAGVVAGRFVPF